MAAFLRSVQAKVTATIIGALLFVVAVNSLLTHEFAMKAQFEQLRQELITVAKTAAVTVDVDALMKIPLNRDGIAAPEYRLISDKLKRIRQDNPKIAYVYILTRTAREGVFQFMADADPAQKRHEGITSYPGDKYDARRFPEMIRAWDAASADRTLGRDAWGVILSGYAPLRDSRGVTIAVLGIDMMASDVYAMHRQLHSRVLLVLVFGILLSVILGMVLSRQITKPVHRLLEGVRRIARGDLVFRVKERGHDEIAELSREFNRMARELAEARRKNSEYFYGVIQSMVRIVEAKDHYTRGHSERVAEYSVKIARRMGFPSHDLDMLKQVAVLHDIGKLGIHDAVLNKPGKLDPDEWDMVKMHPVTGEEILKPVLLDPRMLAIVRSHHERYDGKGYPDGLSRDDINALAQVISVADAYDAMTSSRAYRPASLRMEEAMQELQRNKGSQFSPQVVDAFCKILQEENN